MNRTSIYQKVETRISTAWDFIEKGNRKDADRYLTAAGQLIASESFNRFGKRGADLDERWNYVFNKYLEM